MKEIWLHFDMILRAILCVQHFCSFGAMLFIVNLLIKADSNVICVPCMLEHVRYGKKFLMYLYSDQKFTT